MFWVMPDMLYTIERSTFWKCYCAYIVGYTKENGLSFIKNGWNHQSYLVRNAKVHNFGNKNQWALSTSHSTAQPLYVIVSIYYLAAHL